jgi:hypothetical protein
MWTFEYTHPTTARPDAIWLLWSDVAAWPQWDTDLEVVTLDGPFVTGARGTLKPKGMDVFPFVLTRAELDRGYSDETPLDGATLRFDHDLEPTGAGTLIHQRVTVEGPKANEYFALLAANIILDIPQALARLATKAEQLT